MGLNKAWHSSRRSTWNIHIPVTLQVYCSVMGWMDFRDCGKSTFQYVLAAMNPKFLLSSGSMSEDSLISVAGWLLSVVVWENN